MLQLLHKHFWLLFEASNPHKKLGFQCQTFNPHGADVAWRARAHGCHQGASAGGAGRAAQPAVPAAQRERSGTTAAFCLSSHLRPLRMFSNTSRALSCAGRQNLLSSSRVGCSMLNLLCILTYHQQCYDQLWRYVIAHIGIAAGVRRSRCIQRLWCGGS